MGPSSQILPSENELEFNLSRMVKKIAAFVPNDDSTIEVRMADDAISQERRKRALEALERRCAMARADLLQQQKKVKTIEESIENTRDAALNDSSSVFLGKSSNSSVLMPNERSAKRDAKGSDPVYSTLSVAVNENLLATNTKFSERRGTLIYKIFNELLQNGSSTHKYLQVIKGALKVDSWILLDNVVSGRSGLTGSRSRALRNKSKRSKKHMSLKQHKKCGTFVLPPDLHKFEIFWPMHEIWKSFMEKRLKLVGEDALDRSLLIADLHGAFIHVVDCKITSFTGISGIMIRETAETFGIVTKDDKFRVVPKKPSVFVFQFDCWKVTLHGDKLTSRILKLP